LRPWDMTSQRRTSFAPNTADFAQIDGHAA
jgi:hypothetical protein